MRQYKVGIENCELQIVGRSRRGGRRSGLSTLELVLCLPILLFLMALMINFGTVACWKVRALSMARNAAWQARASRGGYSYLPDYWPQTAGVSVGGGGDVPELDDPRVYHVVARGPVLPDGTRVYQERLDPTLRLRQGSARLNREFPMLAKLGPYRLDARTRFLDNKWQWGEMGVGGNYGLRIPVIYELPKAPPAYGQAYMQAVRSIYYAPFRPQLFPLDRDDEFIYYSIRFGWGRGAPDFHPRLARFCSLDHTVAAKRVEELIERIQGSDRRDGVAKRMTDAFIGLYRRVIGELQNQKDPVPTAEIAQLEAKIEVLEKFKATLRK